MTREDRKKLEHAEQMIEEARIIIQDVHAQTNIPDLAEIVRNLDDQKKGVQIMRKIHMGG